MPLQPSSAIQCKNRLRKSLNCTLRIFFNGLQFHHQASGGKRHQGHHLEDNFPASSCHQRFRQNSTYNACESKGGIEETINHRSTPRTKQALCGGWHQSKIARQAEEKQASIRREEKLAMNVNVSSTTRSIFNVDSTFDVVEKGKVTSKSA